MGEQLRIRFGPFVVDKAERLLLRDGQAVKIEPKPLEILCMLLESAGHLVRRPVLERSIWGEMGAPDDQALTTAIHKLRTALGADASTFVVTVHREGYRYEGPSPEPADGERPTPRQSTVEGSILAVNDFQKYVQGATEIVGREGLVDDLHRSLLEDCPGHTVLLFGEPGIGKTGVMQKYVARFPHCHRHFIVRSGGENKAEYCLRNLCAQLIRAYRLSDDLPPAEDLESAQNRFHRLLGIVSDSHGTTGVEIVIDGLDELPEDTQRRWNNPLSIPERPISNIHFLLSARSVNSLRLLSYNSKEINREDTDHRDAIAEYIRQQCDPTKFVEGPSKTEDERYEQATRRQLRLKACAMSVDDLVGEVGRAAQWNFMYVSCVLWELGQGQLEVNAWELLERLPQGLIPYFQDHWERMWKRKKQNEALLKVLHALCKGKLWRRSWLVKVADLEPLEVNRLLEGPWAMFLRCHVGEDGVPRYAFCHNKYLEFMERSANVQGTYEAFGLSFKKLDAELQWKLLDLPPDVREVE